MANKTFPYDKTVVTKFAVEVADLVSRSNKLTGSMASKIVVDANFNNGDATLNAGDPALAISGIKSCVILHAAEGFALSITQGGVTLPDVLCQGIFIYHGQLDAVTIKPRPGDAKIRLRYIWS